MLRLTSGSLGRTKYMFLLIGGTKEQIRRGRSSPHKSNACQIDVFSTGVESRRSSCTVCSLAPDVYTSVTKPLVSSCSPPSRAAADGGPHVVPGRLGIGEGAQLLRARGVALQARSVLSGLGLLRSHRRNSGQLPVCCPVGAG